MRIDSCRQNRKYKGRVGNGLYRGRLYKRRADRWHGLAAFHTMMPMRRALHCIAAFLCLLGCCRGITVKCIGRKSDRE